MVSVETKEVRKMLAAAKRGLKRYSENIPRDAITLFHWKLQNETANGEPGTAGTAPFMARTVVGNVSGRLEDSFQVFQRNRFEWYIKSLSGIANYNEEIDEFVKLRQKNSILGVTRFFYAPMINKNAQEEFKRMVRLINSGQRYTYRNPYPSN